MDQKPIVSVQQRAKSLFSCLCEKHALGEQYPVRIARHVGTFLTQPLISNGEPAGAISIRDEGHLVVIVCSEEPLSRERENPPSSVILEINAGKLCPSSEKDFYVDKVVVRGVYDECSQFFRSFPLVGIINDLGAATGIEEFLQKEECSFKEKGEGYFSYEVSFNPKGSEYKQRPAMVF